jgi:hypothetical protein
MIKDGRGAAALSWKNASCCNGTFALRSTQISFFTAWTPCLFGLNKCPFSPLLCRACLITRYKVKRMQRSWIGRSSGSLVTFNLRPLPDSPACPLPLSPVVVFTTRVETIFGTAPRTSPCTSACYYPLVSSTFIWFHKAAPLSLSHRSTPPCRRSLTRAPCRCP